MSHAPQHPHNPCSLDENQRTPAKIWELLRRNGEFRANTERLQELDAHDRSETEQYFQVSSKLNQAIVACDQARKQNESAETLTKLDAQLGAVRQCFDALKSRPFWAQSRALFADVKERQSFAAAALQWLVPEPDFRVWRVAAPTNLDSLDGPQFEFDIIEEGRGTTPDSEDHQHWSWIKRVTHRPRGAVGEPEAKRGPTILWQKCDDPRFQDKVNPLAEWRDYFAKRKFTLDTPWHEAPSGFRETFCHLWRQCDSRTVGPSTGLRHDAPELHETDFFQNWHLSAALTRAAKPGRCESEDLNRILKFDDLAKNYRVFAIPRAILTKGAAREIVKRLEMHIARDLPNEAQILGRVKEWDEFLTIGSSSNREAIRAYVDSHYLPQAISRLDQEYAHMQNRAALVTETRPDVERRERESHETHVRQRVAVIEGLVRMIFPTFDLPALTPRTARRSKQKEKNC